MTKTSKTTATFPSMAQRILAQRDAVKTALEAPVVDGHDIIEVGPNFYICECNRKRHETAPGFAGHLAALHQRHPTAGADWAAKH